MAEQFSLPAEDRPERLQLLYDRIAEAGCYCPGELPRETLAEHTCLPGLAEQVGKTLEVEAAKVVILRAERDTLERARRTLSEERETLRALLTEAVDARGAARCHSVPAPCIDCVEWLARVDAALGR